MQPQGVPMECTCRCWGPTHTIVSERYTDGTVPELYRFRPLPIGPLACRSSLRYDDSFPRGHVLSTSVRFGPTFGTSRCIPQ